MAAEASDLESRLAAMTAGVSAVLEEANGALGPLLDTKPLKNLLSKLQPLEAAKLHSMLAATAVALVALHLRLGGVDPQKHAVASSMAALRTLHGRIKETEALVGGGGGAAASSDAGSAAGRKVDVPAALAGDRGDAGAGAGAAGGKLSGMKRSREEEQQDADTQEAQDAEAAADEEVEAEEEEASSSSSSDEKRQQHATAASAGAPAAKRRALAGATTGSGSGKAAAANSGKQSGRGSGESGAVPVPGAGGSKGAKHGAGDSSRRSTPMPALAHLNWQQEMAAKFGSGKK